MGGDFGPAVTLPACLAFLESHAEAELLIVGPLDGLADHPLHAKLQLHTRCEMLAASEIVSMEDSVEVALRRKKDSSMCRH